MATICWASTSSGLRGTTVLSISPSRMRRATTAHSSRSARNLGKIRPLETSPTPWPARPMRWRPRGDRLGRLDLEHEVHGAHVDAQLERRGGHEARQLARLQQVLDHQALLARERAVVRAGDVGRHGVGRAGSSPASSFSRTARRSAPRRLFTKMIVERCCLHQLEQLGVDRGPDRAPGGRAVERGGIELDARVGLAHVLHRHLDLQVERLAQAGVDDRAVAPGARRGSGPTSSSGRWVADSPMRCTGRPDLRARGARA